MVIKKKNSEFLITENFLQHPSCFWVKQELKLLSCNGVLVRFHGEWCIRKRDEIIGEEAERGFGLRCVEGLVKEEEMC